MKRPPEKSFLEFSVAHIRFLTLSVVAIICATLLYIGFEDSIDKALRPGIKIKADLGPSGDDGVDEDAVSGGIHLATGLAYDQDFDLIRSTCTGCHSAKLITQNRATREGWEQMIEWMQETQGLWDLGDQKPIIVNYLARHYSPEDIGRRASLEDIEWYILKQ